MARTKTRWKEQARGKRTGKLNRTLGSGRVKTVSSARLKAARAGKYGRKTARRARLARR